MLSAVLQARSISLLGRETLRAQNALRVTELLIGDLIFNTSAIIVTSTVFNGWNGWRGRMERSYVE